MLSKKYIIKNPDLLKVLNKYEEFKSTFDRFVMKHKNYDCKTVIEKIGDLWVCKIEINESINNKGTEKVIRALSVLQ
jgi:hypothetical protein